MPARPIPAEEQFANLDWPQAGLDVTSSFGTQRPGTTPIGVNVRTFEPVLNRARGGARPGLSKYIAAIPGGAAALIQEIALLVGVGYTDPAGGSQTNSSGRVVNLLAVVGGKVYVAAPGGSTWTTASGGTLLATTGVVMSAPNNQKLYFADGAHYTYYDPSLNSVLPWTASAGSLPGNGTDFSRLLCTWRGRQVHSGLQTDPQNWFMSAVSDPTNYDYAPFFISPTQAIAGNNSPLGLIGDVVTALIPYSDDLLIMGGDHTIYQVSGDPMSGGQIDRVSDAIGMAWGTPWCKGPDGTVYFMSNQTGIYSMLPGQGQPQRISQPIDPLLLPTNTGTNTINMIWNERFQGLHVFITPTAAAAATTHYFFESRTGAWWQDQFATNNHNPLCCCTFDGNLPTDRVTLIGSWDGYVRAIDPTATTDDGSAIASSIFIGPLLTRNMGMLLLKDLQALLGTSSGSVTYGVYIGATAEAALARSAVSTGTWSAGRNFNDHVRWSGHGIYVKITASNPWALEGIRARIADLGTVQQRGV